ncbi:MAG: hypothetical protein IKV97_03835 [Clostridia bacterium]|nr:hypothetical protein [Clostridia bacterium]
MSEFKDMFNGAVDSICRKTGEAAKITKISLEIEAQKCRLSKIYQRIGEAVVSGALASGDGEEVVFKYIDEAKTEKQRLCELIEKKKELCSKTACKNCGASAKSGTYCGNCGEFVR